MAGGGAFQAEKEKAMQRSWGEEEQGLQCGLSRVNEGGVQGDIGEIHGKLHTGLVSCG